MLTFYLSQNHGGWNSDDNQNNNLGRFRLSITTSATAPWPIRCRSDVREILAIAARASARRLRSRRSSATGARRCRSGRRRTTQIDELWRQHPGGLVAAGRCKRATSRATTHILKRGDFLKPGQVGRSPACRRSCIRCRQTRRRTRLTFARWLVDRNSPTTARSHRQPRLAGLLRHRPRQHQRRPRHAERCRRRIPNCSTGWPSSSWTRRLEPEEALHRLIVTSATYRQSSPMTPELLDARSCTTGCWRAGRGSASRPRSCATSRSRPAAC